MAKRLFSNTYWKVTPDGLVSRVQQPPVSIEADDLLAKGRDGAAEIYYWPAACYRHEWATPRRFMDAFFQAVYAHERQCGIHDPDTMRAT